MRAIHRYKLSLGKGTQRRELCGPTIDTLNSSQTFLRDMLTNVHTRGLIDSSAAILDVCGPDVNGASFCGGATKLHSGRTNNEQSVSF
jgi:hypothetical protein